MKLNSVEQYRTLLEENTKDLDVGVVIANAGWAHIGYYHWLEDS